MLRKTISYFILRSFAKNQHPLSQSDNNFVTCYRGFRLTPELWGSLSKCPKVPLVSAQNSSQPLSRGGIPSGTVLPPSFPLPLPLQPSLWEIQGIPFTQISTEFLSHLRVSRKSVGNHRLQGPKTSGSSSRPCGCN